MATAPPTVALQAAMADDRAAPWKSWPMSASEVANMAAPPTPCSDRDAISSAGVCDSPHAAEARVNTARPNMKMRLRPNLSAIAPWVRIRAERLRA